MLAESISSFLTVLITFTHSSLSKRKRCGEKREDWELFRPGLSGDLSVISGFQLVAQFPKAVLSDRDQCKKFIWVTHIDILYFFNEQDHQKKH